MTQALVTLVLMTLVTLVLMTLVTIVIKGHLASVAAPRPEFFLPCRVPSVLQVIQSNPHGWQFLHFSVK